MRWNTRSAPERSTRTAMPGYFASNALPTFSASGRSTEVYQTTLPSFFAASISAGVDRFGRPAPARTTRVANAAAPSAVVPFRMSRRDQTSCASSPSTIILLTQHPSPHGLIDFGHALSYQHPAALRRQFQPDLLALRDVLLRRRHHAQLRAVGKLHHIVAAVAEKDVADDGRRNRRSAPAALFARQARSRAGGSKSRRARPAIIGSPVQRSAHAGDLECGGIERLALHDIARPDEARDEFRARAVVDLLRRAGLLDLAERSSRRSGRRWSSPRTGRASRRPSCSGTRRAGGAPRSASPRADWRRGSTAARRAASVSGSTISARASATRCCCPPDSSPG